MTNERNRKNNRHTFDLKISVWIVSFIVFNNTVFCQNILNGDFEINSAPTGIDQIALTNLQFNSIVPHCNSFGSSSTGLDLITTDNWDGLAFCGNWYLGIEGGGIEQFSMELSTTLLSGVNYKISFYDRGRAVHCPASIEIGTSAVYNDFGLLVYTAPVPTIGEWNLRCFTFTAQSDIQFITVRAGNTTGCWTKIDCFTIEITDSPCIDFSMPNVFTPNNDGINDFFKPISFKGIKQGKMTILNRWGQTVFETEDMINGWDGSDNNKQCSDGVYYWFVTYTNIFDETKTETGFLTLIR
jgi:gliding motility-associated-like protein